MRYKKNDLLELAVESMTDLGFGVAKLDGAVVFVADTVPGDEIVARIIKVSSSYLVARIEEYKKRSDLRTEGRCQIAQCKSCAYRNISYAEEQRLKYNGVVADFKKAGLSGIEVLPLISSPSEHFYRNKAQYPVASDGKGGYKIGFFAPKSHRVTEAAGCPLAPAVFEEIIEELRAYFKEFSIPAYDEESGAGLVRHIYLRRGEVSGEILLTLVINGKKIPRNDMLVERIAAKFPQVVGILLNINTEKTNIILGEKFITLFGRDYIVDTLAGVKLRISAPSFYQVNHAAAELLYAKARELAKPTGEDTLLDLYCGAGSIGLSMANEVGELIGIEIVESAVECAKINAAENGIKNARFFAGDAKYTERMLDTAERKLGRKISPDIVILDPPRGGCSEELISFVSRLNPKRIVYISCNPTTLARDVKLFSELGYTCPSVTPFDLFPMTGHVESVVCLTRRLDNELRERMN